MPRAAPAAAARSAIVGQGHGAGVAVDGAGTAFVAWKNESQDNAVFFCTLARNARACSTPVVPVPFPSSGFNRGSASVVLGPGFVDVVVAREEGLYRARSTDGGRSFATGVKIFESGGALSVGLPDGRIATTGSGLSVSAGVARPGGEDAATESTILNGEALSGFYYDIATSGGDVVVSGGDNSSSTSFRLPAGANPVDPNQWQPLPRQDGGRGRVAGGPAGIFSLLDTEPTGAGAISAQRLENGIWAPGVTIEPDTGLLYTLALEQDPSGRLHALWTDEPGGADDVLFYATSEDAGALWSRKAVLAPLKSRLSDLSADVGPDGRGAIVAGTISGDEPIQVVWTDAGRVPAATTRIGDTVVQVRSSCSGTRGVRVHARASRGGREVAVAPVLSSARFTSRTARRTSRTRYSSRFRLRRQRKSATVSVRLDPRASGERTRKLKLRALACGGRL